MAEEPKIKGNTQEQRLASLWTAVSSLLGAKDVSIQLYTSKRGRTWCSVKQWVPVRYATAVECTDPASPARVAGALGIACLLHVSKRTGGLPLSDTWHQADEVTMDDDRLAAWLDLGELPDLPTDDGEH